MTIDKVINGKEMTVALTGRLDTTTAPELESAIKGEFASADTLTFDFANLEYISSAGLRVLLSAHKAMAHGKMTVKNVNDTINEVFEITGFCDILNIE